MALSGPVGSGKSTLAKGLSQLGFEILKTRDILLDKVATTTRESLQRAGDALDKKTDGEWVLDALSKLILSENANSKFVIDSIRIKKQVDSIRQAYGNVIHVHLTAPVDILTERYAKRAKGKRGRGTYSKVRLNRTEANIESLSAIADIVIDTARSTARDVLSRVIGQLWTRIGDSGSYVDVIVGGQYGSEGKGQVSAYLAPEYDLLVRVGGPNAGHKVFEDPKPYTHHQLPSGTRRCNAKLLLTPGMNLNVEKLLKEIAECEVDANRLSIDPQAMIISPDDITGEVELKRRIGSTAQGVGRATARRITDRLPNAVKLAKDVKELKPFIRRATDVLFETFSSGGKVLVEGTQGFGLSLYHGYYPHVTSRDTSVAGCLSESGIPPNRVRRVVMVCRTYPIRVQNGPRGSSGPMSQELTLNEISKRSGVPLKELRCIEKTSTTNRKRRIAEFDWALLRQATAVNGPTDIALSFVDYIAIKNRKAKRMEQLTSDTINFIDEVERVSGARVSLISTGFNSRPIIDRRQW